MGKVIARIYKYDHRNWPYPSQDTTFVIPQWSDTSIQTQRNSASDVPVGAHYISSSVLYQSTNHHGNTDVKDNDDSQSFETPKKNNFYSSYFGDTITTTITPHLPTMPPPGK